MFEWNKSFIEKKQCSDKHHLTSNQKVLRDGGSENLVANNSLFGVFKCGRSSGWLRASFEEPQFLPRFVAYTSLALRLLWLGKVLPNSGPSCLWVPLRMPRFSGGPGLLSGRTFFSLWDYSRWKFIFESPWFGHLPHLVLHRLNRELTSFLPRLPRVETSRLGAKWARFPRAQWPQLRRPVGKG